EPRCSLRHGSDPRLPHPSQALRRMTPAGSGSSGPSTPPPVGVESRPPHSRGPVVLLAKTVRGRGTLGASSRASFQQSARVWQVSGCIPLRTSKVKASRSTPRCWSEVDPSLWPARLAVEQPGILSVGVLTGPRHVEQLYDSASLRVPVPATARHHGEL